MRVRKWNGLDEKWGRKERKKKGIPVDLIQIMSGVTENLLQLCGCLSLLMPLSVSWYILLVYVSESVCVCVCEGTSKEKSWEQLIVKIFLLSRQRLSIGVPVFLVLEEGYPCLPLSASLLLMKALPVKAVCQRAALHCSKAPYYAQTNAHSNCG